MTVASTPTPLPDGAPPRPRGPISCLAPERNARQAVRSAKPVARTGQPVYATSVERWRRASPLPTGLHARTLRSEADASSRAR